MKRKFRSRTKTRDLAKTRKKILDAAFKEVFTHGFQGVSVDDIVRKTSMTKGAFYHQFPTKLDLGYALVEEVIQPMLMERWIMPLQFYDNPLEGILDRMKKMIGEVDPVHRRLGCPLNNLIQEMAPLDRGFSRRLQKVIHIWIDEVDKHLKRAKQRGLLRTDVKTKHVAYFVVMAHEGFYGLLKGVNDQRAFDALFGSLKRYFQTLAV